MDFIPLIGLLGQLFGTVSSGQAASQASSRASEADAAQAETLREYLADYRKMRPYRDYLGETFSHRASEKPFYSAVWGRYGGGNTPPFQGGNQ